LRFLERGPEHVVQVKAFVHPVGKREEVQREIVAFFGKVAVPPIVLVEWTFKDSIEIELVVAGAPARASRERERPEASRERQRPEATSAVDYLTPPGMTASPIYCRVCRINHGKRVYIGGLYGAGDTGAGQVKDIFAQLGALLKKTGSDFRHLAKATYYVSTDDASKQLNVLRPNYYDPKRPPAASKAPVRGVGQKGRGIAIDMIAVVP
jgi:enamine deaminase RidA (YjgF/YER057c/UK114 family)